MEESKASEAELTLRRSQQDEGKTVYALVSIKNGYAVFKDVMIDRHSIREVFKANEKGD